MTSAPILRYGIDAVYVPVLLAVGGLVLLVLGGVESSVWLLVIGIFLLAQAAIYSYATLIGKHRIWRRLLDRLELRGGEQVLDLGCGRGAVLIAVAQRLDSGTVTGIDLWRSRDQSGNDEQRTRTNAVDAGVDDRVRLDTGDLRDLPYPDGAFDVVVSSLAIHNISGDDERSRAIDEAYRVLRPGGKICIADIRSARDYGRRLRELGAADVEVHGLGPDGWFAGPWVAMRSVIAVRPSSAGLHKLQ